MANDVFGEARDKVGRVVAIENKRVGGRFARGGRGFGAETDGEENGRLAILQNGLVIQNNFHIHAAIVRKGD